MDWPKCCVNSRKYIFLKLIVLTTENIQRRDLNIPTKLKIMNLLNELSIVFNFHKFLSSLGIYPQLILIVTDNLKLSIKLKRKLLNEENINL